MKTGKRRFGVTGMSAGKKTTNQPPKTIQKATLSSSKSEDVVEHDSDEGNSFTWNKINIKNFRAQGWTKNDQIVWQKIQGKYYA